MKRILCLMAIVLPMLILSSCGGDDDEPEVILQSVVGVWQNGNYFVSFSESGYYCAYLGNDFLDSGNFKRDKDEITAVNPFFSRTSTFTIKQLDDKNLTVEIDYTDVYGEQHHDALSLQKQDTEPAKEGQLIGKSYSWLTSTFGYITMSFNTANSGVKSAQRGSAANYPLNFFYFYIADRMYYQIIPNRSIQVPSIGGWSDSQTYYSARCEPVEIEADGSLWSGAAIEI